MIFRFWNPVMVADTPVPLDAARIICDLAGTWAVPADDGRVWLCYWHPQAQRALCSRT